MGVTAAIRMRQRWQLLRERLWQIASLQTPLRSKALGFAANRHYRGLSEPSAVSF